MNNIPCLQAIKNGICHADCCRMTIIPFMSKAYELLFQYAYCMPDEILKMYDIIYPMREDLICIFLDQDTNMCRIYPMRPSICNNYGSGTVNNTHNCLHYNCNGTPLTRTQRRNLKRTHDTHESVRKDYELLKAAIKKNGLPDESLLNKIQIVELMNIRSFALPTMTAEYIMENHPEMVVDLNYENLPIDILVKKVFE